MAPQGGQPRQAVEIATNAETAIAGKVALPIEDRQARQFDWQRPAAIDRPIQRDAAPGLARGKGLHHAAIGIEGEGLRDLAPQPAAAGSSAGADQTGELVGAEPEAA